MVEPHLLPAQQVSVSARRLALFFVVGGLLFGAKQLLFADRPERARVVVQLEAGEDREHAIDRALLARSAADQGLALHDPVVRERLRAMFPELRQREQTVSAARFDAELTERARSLDLFAEDPMLRNRLASNAVLALHASGATREPSTSELTAFFAAHRERYRRAPRVSFTQLFVAHDKHGQRTREAAEQLRATLTQRALPPEDTAALGEPSNLARHWQDVSYEVVQTRFGGPLSSALATLPLGAWSEPVASSLGYHVLWVAARSASSALTLGDVRARVRADLLEEQRARQLRDHLTVLRTLYLVEVQS